MGVIISVCKQNTNETGSKQITNMTETENYK